MSNIKNKKVTTFSEASKFWWSIFWRSHFVSIILLLIITLILFLLSPNQDASSFTPTVLQIIYHTWLAEISSEKYIRTKIQYPETIIKN